MSTFPCGCNYTDQHFSPCGFHGPIPAELNAEAEKLRATLLDVARMAIRRLEALREQTGVDSPASIQILASVIKRTEADALGGK